MRSEESKCTLDEQILELYDCGMSIQTISQRLDAAPEYIEHVLKNITLETT